MSTLKVSTLQNASSATANITLDTAGNATVGNTLAMGSSFLRNRIINGDMRIDQRNAGASTSIGAGGYTTVDRFGVGVGSGSGHTIQQSTDAPSTFASSIKITIGTGASPTSAQFSGFWQNVEGYNVADFNLGSASALAITFSFWVKASITGTYSIGFMNSALNRNYITNYTVSNANTWEKKVITLTGDITGTWQNTNGTGLSIAWDLGCGTNFEASANAWGTGQKYRTSGSVQLVANSGATFYITGVQLEVGSVATPFERRQYGQALALCQRYYEKSYNLSTAPGTANQTDGLVSNKVASNTVASSEQYGPTLFKVTKRAIPTVTIYGYGGGSGKVSSPAGTDLAANSGTVNWPGTYGFTTYNNSGGTLTTVQIAVINHFTADAEL